MFEKSLKAKFEKIFGIAKVTYAQPSEVKEQDCLFIEVEQPRNQIKDGVAIARVTGRAYVYSQGEKIPFGYFSKRIAKADLAETKDFVFSDIEVNDKYFQNLVMRSFNFMYFFKDQYDPKIGSITTINLTVEETLP